MRARTRILFVVLFTGLLFSSMAFSASAFVGTSRTAHQRGRPENPGENAIVDTIGPVGTGASFNIFGSGGQIIAPYQYTGACFVLEKRTMITEIGGYIDCVNFTAGQGDCNDPAPFQVEIRPAVNGVPHPSIVLGTWDLSHDHNAIMVRYESTTGMQALHLWAGEYCALFRPKGEDIGIVLSSSFVPSFFLPANIALGYLFPETGEGATQTVPAAIRILGRGPGSHR